VERKAKYIADMLGEILLNDTPYQTFINITRLIYINMLDMLQPTINAFIEVSVVRLNLASTA